MSLVSVHAALKYVGEAAADECDSQQRRRVSRLSFIVSVDRSID